MNKVAVKRWDELEDRVPVHALVSDVDLVITRYDDAVSALYGRCAHRGALMSDGHVDGLAVFAAPGAKTMVGWNISRAATILGVERTNLHKKMRSYGIRRAEA